MAEHVKDRLRWDLQSADIILSLFTSALMSYRRDSLLRPCPPMFVNLVSSSGASRVENREKDFEALKEALQNIPSLPDLCNDDNTLSQVNSNSLMLLAWLLESLGSAVRSVDRRHFESIKQLTGEEGSVSEPSYIFEVVPNPTAAGRFEAARGDRKLLYGYHGSRVENFYSILQNGLQYHLNKNSLYGQGIYLSSELSMCFLYSPSGLGWDKSVLGEKLSCVAVCEMIDHPDVKCQLGGDSLDDKSRAHVRDSEGGDVPEKYYVVQNSSLVRLKYLLVYGDKRTARRRNSGTETANQPWYFRYKSVIVLGAYALVLCAVGLMNSRPFTLFLRRLLS